MRTQLRRHLQWVGGQITRLSDPPEQCDCSSLDSEPEATGNGHYYYEQTHYACLDPFCNPPSFGETIKAASLAGGSVLDIESPCSDEQQPSPDPVNGALVAYTGCTGDDLFSDGDFHEYLVVSGIGRAGEYEPAYANLDGETLHDPSWSPDGASIALVVADSPDAGIWVFSGQKGCSVQCNHKLIAGSGLSSPRFVGDGTIVFSAAGDLWTVAAAGCRGCAFPNGATRLTAGGGNTNPAWTATTFPPAAAPPAGGGAGPGTRAASSPTTLLASVSLARHRVFRSAKGVTFVVVLRAPATVEIRIERLVSGGATARMPSRVLGTLRFNGRRGRNTFTSSGSTERGCVRAATAPESSL